MGTLEIRLFGTFRLERDGRPLRGASSRRVRDVLCYLLLNRDMPQSREYLAGLLWSDLDDRKARHCFNTALWRLNGVLGEPRSRLNPYLDVDAQNIRFSTTSDHWLDVAEFEARCTSAAQLADVAPELQVVLYWQAVPLYRGELLVDCFEDWCLVERQRLQHLYIQALAWLQAHHAARDEIDAAIECGRRILTIDPLREEVHRDLIELYLGSGQPTAALRQYRACEAAIRRELGINPMPETRALLERIIRASDATEWLGGTLGSDRPPLVGRRAIDELATALTRLHEAGSALDAARSRLVEATVSVETLVRRLNAGDQLSAAPVSRPAEHDDLTRAETAVARVIADLQSLTATGSRALE
jgi:DNA-binding SARP family transcriptional activator